MAIDWSLLRQPDIIGNALSAYDEGKKMRADEASKKALKGIMMGIPSPQTGVTPGTAPATPAAPNAAWNDLNPQDFQTAFAWQTKQTDAATKAQERMREQMQVTSNLLRTVQADPSKYAQVRQAAIQLGESPDRIPETYNPEWVDQQLLIAKAFEKDGGQQMSGIARELVDAGYRPGTPEFVQAMTSVINNKYAAEYVNERGDTVRRSALNISPPPPPQQVSQAPKSQKPPMFRQEYGALVQQLGKSEAVRFVKDHGYAIPVETPEQATSLPSGTPILLPDGSEGVVP